MRTWSWRRSGNGAQDGAIFLDDYVVVRLDFELSPITDSHDGIDGTAQFIVDALNAAEYDDGTRRKGKALIDSLQAIIDEKQSILDEIDAKLAEAVRRTNG